MTLQVPADAKVIDLTEWARDQIPTTVIVCGSRSANNLQVVHTMLNNFHKQYNIIHLIEGGASGVDYFARVWAALNKIKSTTIYADWDQHGKSAGPKRNKMMLEMKPDVVVAFPGGKGTANMVKQANKVGVLVVPVTVV